MKRHAIIAGRVAGEAVGAVGGGDISRNGRSDAVEQIHRHTKETGLADVLHAIGIVIDPHEVTHRRGLNIPLSKVDSVSPDISGRQRGLTGTRVRIGVETVVAALVRRADEVTDARNKFDSVVARTRPGNEYAPPPP